MNDYETEPTTIWSFPNRGKWSTHTSKFRGNWSPQVVRNLILHYSNSGDLVLDPFLGSGTTLIEAKLLNRRGIGIDINPAFAEQAIKRIRNAVGPELRQEVFRADSRFLHFLKPGQVDLALLHPPYSNSIKYSEIQGDLSTISSVESFCHELEQVINTVSNLLRSGGTMAIMMGDTRKNKRVVPLGFKVFELCMKNELVPKEIVIKIQHNCSSTEKWLSIAKRMNFLLLMHEYIFVFNKR